MIAVGGIAPPQHQRSYMGGGQHPGFQHQQLQHHHNNRGGFVPRGRGYGGAGGYMGRGRGGYHHGGDQRPYGKPPGTDYEKKEERKEQIVDYFLVLDLEGKQEILEFPVAIVSAKTLEVEDFFHRSARLPLFHSTSSFASYLPRRNLILIDIFEMLANRYVRPVTFSDEQLAQYINGKYGKFGLTEKWFESAMPFTDVLVQFNDWLGHHGLLHSILRSGTSTCPPPQSPRLCPSL